MPRYPFKYVVPNAITCASLTLGLVSVFQSMGHEFESAAWFIMLSVLFDKLDGTVARALHASSSFGVQLDSFSDFITFGVAPGFLVHALLTTPELTGSLYLDNGAYTWLLRVSVIVFVLASCLRLAKFNVLTERIGGGYFLGIPTTMAGAFTATYILTVQKYDLSVTFLHLTPAIFLALSVLMVSNLKLPKVKLSKSMPARIFQIANIAGIYACGILWVFPEYLLTIGVGYLVVGFIYGAVKMRHLPVWPPTDDQPLEAHGTSS